MNSGDYTTIQLKSKMAENFSLLLAREFLLKIFAFVAQLILARFLSPDDFGFYVIIIFLVSFFGLFADMGLSPSIIQKKENPTTQELSTIFFVQATNALLLIFLIFVVTPLIYRLYPTFKDTHIAMLHIASVILLLSSLRSIPIALLERKLAYATISKIDIFGIVTYYLTGVFFAYIGFHTWSLIFATLAKEFIEVCLIYIFAPWFPGFYFDYKKIKQMMHFGLFIQGTGILNFINASVTPLIAGTQKGSYSVGLLSWASNLAKTPVDAITNSFGRIAFSGFKHMQTDRILLKKTVEKSSGIVSILLFFIPVLLFGLGKEGISIVYTDKWYPAVPALYWFTASVIFDAVIVSLGQGILVLGASKPIFIVTLISNIFNIVLSFLLLLSFGFLGIAISSFFTSFFLFLMYIFIGSKMQLSIDISAFIPKIAIVFSTIVFISVMNLLLPHNFIIFITKSILSILVYFLFMFLFSRNDMVAIIVVSLGLIKLHKLAEFSKKLALKNEI